jgi:hypothetical protein
MPQCVMTTFLKVEKLKSDWGAPRSDVPYHYLVPVSINTMTYSSCLIDGNPGSCIRSHERCYAKNKPIHYPTQHAGKDFFGNPGEEIYVTVLCGPSRQDSALGRSRPLQ